MKKELIESLSSYEQQELISLLEWYSLHTESKRLSESLPEFCKAAWICIEGSRALAWNWHIDLICSNLTQIQSGTNRRIIFNVPPRTTKSTIVSVMFPCWLWTINPFLQFMFASYSWGLSQDHAYKRRAILESDWYGSLFGKKITIRGDRNNIMNIANESGGIMYSTSSGGSITGRGADYLILDDPNDTKEAESETQRQTLHNWYDVTWSTRANDQSTVREIIIQQRTHIDDITGHALKTGTWKLIKIPMEYDPQNRTDGDKRTITGELIDSKRFPKEEVEALKKRVGPYAWAGQYQQEPYPLGGGIIKSSWLNRWVQSDKQPNYISVMGGQYHFDPWKAFRFCTVDPAVATKSIGEKKINDPDYTVIAAWCVFQATQGPILILLDLIRGRIEGPDIVPKIKAIHEHWKFSMIGIETIAFQLMLFQQAIRERLPVREISTKTDGSAIYCIDKDKVGRVLSATPLLANGRFFIPQYAPWLSDFESELLSFPNGAHDDCCDVLSSAVAIAEKYRGRIFNDESQSKTSTFQLSDHRQLEGDTGSTNLSNFYGAAPDGLPQY